MSRTEKRAEKNALKTAAHVHDLVERQKAERLAQRTEAEKAKEKRRNPKNGIRMKLLVGVVNVGDDKKITEIANTYGAALSYKFDAFGTARTAVLDYLGLGETKKKLVVSIIPDTSERQILEGIQNEMSLYLVGRGICFTLPLTGVSSIVAHGLIKGVAQDKNSGRDKMKDEKTERSYDLIVAAMQSGYAEDAMEAARSAGAAGGTLIHASTLNNRKAEQLIGVTLQQETEILMILTAREGKLEIMRAIQETAGLKTDAGGVLFSLPVDNLIGVGAMNPVTDEPHAE